MMFHNIRKAAKKANLSEEDTKIFIKFFSERFPDESDSITCYVDEWAERFKTADPENYMDEISIAIYQEARKNV